MPTSDAFAPSVLSPPTVASTASRSGRLKVEEEHERERIRLARESLAENERRLDEQERHREEAWRLQETLLLDSIATSIRESATAAPPPPSRRQRAAARRGQLPTGVRRSTSTATAAQQRGPTNRQSNRSRSRSRPSRRSTSRRRGPQVGGQAGAFLPPVQLQGTNLPPSHSSRVEAPASMELKFELDTRLTVSGIVVGCCMYGFTATSIAINSALLAFAYAIILLLIIFILFGLKDILTRKPSTNFR